MLRACATFLIQRQISTARLKGAAGRLISMPAFLAKERIRKLWNELPPQLRPTFPLARSSKLASSNGFDLSPAPTELTDFVAEFDRFCDEWHLLGMTTWDLPDVRGPHLVPSFSPRSTTQWRLDRYRPMAFFLFAPRTGSDKCWRANTVFEPHLAG